MASEVPEELAVDPAWVHGDLQRLRTRMELHASVERIRQLKAHQGSVMHQVANLERTIPKQQRRVEELTKELQELQAHLEENLRRQAEGQRVVEGTRNQVFYHRGLARNYFVPSASPAGGPAPLPPSCPLSLYGFSLLARCTGGTLPPTEASVSAFLKLCAPLFQWSQEERVVRPPFFFDEPCLMDTTAAAAAAGADSPTSSPSPAEAEAAEPLRCRNVACAFWHVDQLAHVKMAARFCAVTLDESFVADAQMCGVRQILTRLQRQVELSESVAAVCALMCETLQTLIGTGLGAWAGRPVAGPKPFVPFVAAVESPSQFRRRAGLLWRAEEQQRWAPLGSLAIQDASKTAAQLFRQHRDALAWRCLLTTIADAEQRRWLAQQGALLFPSCPQLHLEYINACVRLNSDAAVVAEACLESCRALSVQAAACVVSALDGGQYGTLVARHVGYMVALTFVHCAKTDPAAAQRFLTPLLSAEPDAALAVLLLPVARQNLTLMAVALRRTGHLRGAEHLPLAAISDHPLELSCPDGANPADSGRDSIYAALRIIAACKRDGLGANLTSACAGALQLSLLRTFSHRLSYMERVAEKTVPDSVLAQSAMYGDYVAAVAQQQSVPAAEHIAATLAVAEGTSCLACLLLSLQLCQWGHTSTTHGEACLKRFCAAEQLPVETFDSADRLREAAATHAEVPAVEWVAACALRRYVTVAAAADGAEAAAEEDAAGDGAWTALQSFPLEVLSADPVATALHGTLVLRHCAAASSGGHFYAALHRCLVQLREMHLRGWSALDASFYEMVGLPHAFALWVYEAVPLLLGAAGKEVATWRILVVAAAEKVGVLHPLMVAHDAAS